MKVSTGLKGLTAALSLLAAPQLLAAPSACNAKQHNAAIAFAQQGKFERAAEKLESVVADCRKAPGIRHDNTLRAMESLSQVYAEQGQWQKVPRLLAEVLQVRSSKLGDQHPEVLVLKNNLGMAYMKAGQLDRAEPLFSELLAVMQADGKEPSADSLRVMNNLTTVYGQQGKREKALPLQQQLLASLQARMGKSHPLTLQAGNNLAQTLQALGRIPEAIDITRQVLDGLKASVGEKDRRTLIAMGNLASLMVEQRDLEGAGQLLSQALELSADRKHPDTLPLRANLAMVRKLEGKTDQAVQILQDTLTDAQETLGEQDPLTADIQFNMAEVYYQTGKPQSGWPLLRKSHQTLLALYGPQHPDVIARLPEVLAAAERQGEALDYLQQFDPAVVKQAQMQIEDARKLLKIEK